VAGMCEDDQGDAGPSAREVEQCGRLCYLCFVQRKTVMVTCCLTALMSAGLAAADRCHTPLAGTHSLTLKADVTGYRFSAGHVLVDWIRPDGCQGTAVWGYRAAIRTAKKTTSCRARSLRRARGSLGRLSASDAQHVVQVVAAASADAPVRLNVVDRAANKETASWPLPTMPDRVSVYRGLALLSTAGRGGLYVARLSDGRIGQIGVTRAGDRPVIGSAGVLYQDDLDLAKHRNAPAERTLLLVPLQTVQKELSRPFTTVRKYMSYSSPTYSSPKPVHAATAPDAVSKRSAPRRPMYLHADPPRPFVSPIITAMAMDGERVALAVRDPRRQCDYVLFWNVDWHYVTRLTRAMGLTCPPRHARGGITNVAIAGSRAAWTVDYGGQTRVLAAVISNCAEWVVTRAQRVEALGGDGGVLAYALSPRTTSPEHSSVGIVSSTWAGHPLAYGGSALGLSVDADRIAVLGSGGSVSVETRTGRPLTQLHVNQARGVALRGDVLAVVTRGSVEVYSVSGNRRIASWKGPVGATSIDVQYGIALLVAGRNVYAMNLASGRTARVYHAPTAVRAQIEAPGVALQYNLGRRGYVRFLPMSTIEASTR
jgi:hypothetical protein